MKEALGIVAAESLRGLDGEEELLSKESGGVNHCSGWMSTSFVIPVDVDYYSVSRLCHRAFSVAKRPPKNIDFLHYSCTPDMTRSATALLPIISSPSVERC